MKCLIASAFAASLALATPVMAKPAHPHPTQASHVAKKGHSHAHAATPRKSHKGKPVNARASTHKNAHGHKHATSKH